MLNANEALKQHKKTEKESQYFATNLNRIVAVELTESWKKFLRKHYIKSYGNIEDILNLKQRGYSGVEEYVDKEVMPKYNDGICEFALNELMQIFWPLMYAGSDFPFKDGNIYTKAGWHNSKNILKEMYNDDRRATKRITGDLCKRIASELGGTPTSELWKNIKTEKESQYFATNLNRIVAVELTESWKKFLRKHYIKSYGNIEDILNLKQRGYSGVEEYVDKEVMPKYNDGICEFALNELMQIFWPLMYAGSDFPFKDGNIYTKAGWHDSKDILKKMYNDDRRATKRITGKTREGVASVLER